MAAPYIVTYQLRGVRPVCRTKAYRNVMKLVSLDYYADFHAVLSELAVTVGEPSKFVKKNTLAHRTL